MKLRDIMTSDVYCVSPSETIAEVAASMKRHHVGAMPVCQNGSLVGILTDRDIAIECVASGLNPKDCKVSQFMTSELVYASPDTDLLHVVQLMGREQVHRLPVVENGRLVGMVSIGDIAIHCSDDRLIAQLLREISQPVRSFKAETLAA